MDLSALDRPARLARLAGEPFDLVVVGGGIVGAGIAWDAATRGLKVALVEKGDFASGTSSKSSKLLHGGLRYLEQGEVALVFESLAQRNRLFGDAPHLARRLDFLFPIFKGGKDKGLVIGAGLWLYDLLSHVTFPRGPWHKRLRPAAARAAEPAIRADGLAAAYRYADGVTEDARLVIETLKSAAGAGALCLNYVEATDLEKDAAGKVVGVRVRDLAPGGGEALTVRAARVFAAAGPWVDAVLKLDDPAARRRVRPTKGVHVVVESFVADHAVVMRSVDPREQSPRVMFAIPWEGRTVIGTTDTDPQGPPGDESYLDHDVEASPEEVRYLLDAANATFGTALGEADVIAAFAGWRPLIAPAEAGLSASAVSREHEVFETASGLLAIAGGKLTAYRAMARQAVNAVFHSLARERGGLPRIPPSTIEERALSGSELGNLSLDAFVADAAARPPAGLDADAAGGLARRFGTNWPALRAMIEADPTLAEPLPGIAGTAPRWKVEVAYAVRAEGALTPADYLMRRTRLFLLDADQGLGAVEAVAQAMAAELAPARGWDAAAREGWVRHGVAAYREIVTRSRRARSVPEERREAG
jgi:glycerol-3-phosphate dehydrogenase